MDERETKEYASLSKRLSSSPDVSPLAPLIFYYMLYLLLPYALHRLSLTFTRCFTRCFTQPPCSHSLSRVGMREWVSSLGRGDRSNDGVDEGLELLVYETMSY